MSVGFRILLPLVMLCIASACRSHPKPATRAVVTRPVSRPSTQPLISLRRGTGSFPLATTRPLATVGALAESLRDGYLVRIVPAKPDFITVAGSLDGIDLLRIDVSHAAVRKDYRPRSFDKVMETERTLTVRRLEYVADGLTYRAASARLSLMADDARLDVVRDAKNVRGLTLAGARRGELLFHADTADLDRMVTFASGNGTSLTVVRSTFSFTSDDPRSLAATLDVRARWLLLPMTFSIRGRLTASASGDVTFSELAATGYDPGGLLAAGFLNPELHKVDGHTQPILAFPDPATRVTDVRFSAVDGFTLTVDFGR